jgi:hypothetical protein
MEKTKTLDTWVEKYILEILPKIKEVLNPQSVIIFGSRVKGKGSEESDIDVLIVSDYFSDKSFLGRMPMMLRTFRFPRSVDYLCYSPDEFEIIKSNSIVVKEALNEGMRVV